MKFSVKNTRDNVEEVVTEGIGLKNVKRQLDLIYGNNYSLNICPSPAIFTVELLVQDLGHKSSGWQIPN